MDPFSLRTWYLSRVGVCLQNADIEEHNYLEGFRDEQPLLKTREDLTVAYKQQRRRPACASARSELCLFVRYLKSTNALLA